MNSDRFPISRRTLLATGAATLGLAAAGLPRIARAGYSETAVADGGTLKGFAMLKGTPPKPDEVLITKDHGHCGEGVVIPDPVRLGADGRLGDAVIALKDVASGKPWPAALKAPNILQARCRFDPFVQVAPKGSELTITNQDPLLHNIHTYEIIGRARRTMFNIAQPQAGQIDKHVLKMRRGHVVEIDCDAHNWMSAWIYTSEHPYVSAADPEAGYAIEGIPPGTYEVTAWHPALGEVSKEVAIAPGKTVDLNIEFTA